MRGAEEVCRRGILEDIITREGPARRSNTLYFVKTAFGCFSLPSSDARRVKRKKIVHLIHDTPTISPCPPARGCIVIPPRMIKLRTFVSGSIKQSVGTTDIPVVPGC